MGTNYFWRHNICSCCGRYDELHIQKSFHTFRGHFSAHEWDVDIAKHVQRPLIASWAQWKAKLLLDGQVWDEYGAQHDTDGFIADVERVPMERRRAQHDYCVEHYPRGAIGYREVGVGPNMQWVCPDGFSFYGGEFS